MSAILNFKNWVRLNEEAEDSSSKGIGLKVIGMIMVATGTLNTDEPKIETALNLLRNKEDYNAALNIVKTGTQVKEQYGKNFDTIADMIQTAFFVTKSGVKDWSGDEAWLAKYEKILTKFNSKDVFTVDSSLMMG